MDETELKKLDRFSESVSAEVEVKISKIMEEANKLCNERIEKTEDDSLLDAYNRIQKAVRDTEAKYRRMYALEEQKIRIRTLKHREELSNQIFADVEEKIKVFRESEKYYEYLNKISECENLSKTAVLVFSVKDEKYAKEASKKYGVSFKLDDSIEFGGLMIIDEENGLIIDKTFDSALEEQKKSFSSKYSFKTAN